MPRLSQREQEMCILVNDQDATAGRIFGSIGHTHYQREFRNFDISHAKHIFVVTNTIGLESLSNIIRQANDAHRLRAILIREEINKNWVTRILERANLRTLRNLLVHSGFEVPRRVLTAWKYEQEDKLIADAAVFGDCLLVLDCAMKTYEVPFKAIRGLKRIPKVQRDQFVITEEGSHIRWPKADVDLDIETIRSVLDPRTADQANARALMHNQWFGAAIAQLRKSHKLRQDEIPGISDRQLRRIESGEHASARSLEFLAAAHKMSLNNYLSHIAKIGQVIKSSNG
ncbi:MAG: DUF2442 domain-containing protein [Candidatus Obscuribacterales bacterium]|nr:DUF2442 domain-containing protein [Candidatus Obscuribacterales bacterium]